MRPLFPNEARLRGLTYGSNLYYDLDIEFSMKERREGKEDKVIYENIDIKSLKDELEGKILQTEHVSVNVSEAYI